MAAVVTGALAVVRDDTGKLRYYYQGAQLPKDISSDEVQRLVDRGLVSQVAEPEELTAEDLGLEPSDDPDDEGDGGDGGGDAPPKAAPKDAWVDYAVSQGATREDAEKATKQELIDAYGA